MGHLIELLVILMTCATARGGEPLPSWSEALDNDFEAEQSNSRHGPPRLRVYPSKRTVAQCLAFQVTIFNIK